MRIIRMQATFGKLDNAQLTVTPGLNIIQGANEWGKSTWCAFLLAMFYGLDTRAKTSKTSLADKERYAPWSGKPMEGRIDLQWQGRNITIQRSTRGRIPLGEFRAYETQTGLPIPELTAANCGEMLLGAQQSVFRRAGFIRLKDLPVTEDDALRSRLNALVTTADESGDGEKLERGLRELRNRCRYNRTGLLPQTEAKALALRQKLEEISVLDGHIAAMERRLEELRHQSGLLENHLEALDYAAGQEDAARVNRATQQQTLARTQLAQLEQVCSQLPTRESSQEKLAQLAQCRKSWETLQHQLALLPPQPEEATLPLPFTGITPEQAADIVEQDTRDYYALRRPGATAAGILLGILALIASAYFWLRGKPVFALGFGALAALAGILGLLGLGRRRRRIRALQEKYNAPTPDFWQLHLQQAVQNYREQVTRNHRSRAARADLNRQLEELNVHLQALCGGKSPETMVQLWQHTLDQWQAHDAAVLRLAQAQQHLETLQAMLKPTQPPKQEDTLTYPRKHTLTLLEENARMQQHLLERLGQYRGKRQTLGEPDNLHNALAACQERCAKLEQIYSAAVLGLQTLEQAQQELQRRFAPRITRQATQYLAHLTRGRYRQLRLDQDLALHTQAEGENVLREALWRSEGTVDQLYLALRLAVAQELTPHAPLVLDDALVRFDDNRLAAALEVLEQIAQTRQILLFTCQSRENTLRNTKSEGQ